MKRKLILAFALFSCFEAAAMEKTKELSTVKPRVQDKVLLLISDETDAGACHRVEISLQLVPYIGALKAVLESSELMRLPHHLPNVTVSTWRVIEPWLVQLSDSVHDDAAVEQVRKEIVAAFGRLRSHSLIEIIRACDYLEIPQLLECANESVSKQNLCHTYTFNQISSLPSDLGNRLILQELLKDLGTVPIYYPANEGITIEGPDLFTASYILEDGKIISGFEDGTLSINDSEGFEFAQWKAHANCVWSIDVQKGIIVSGSGDGTLGVWDMQGNKIAQWKAHEEPVETVCVTTDLKIISGSLDNTVRVWRMDGTPEALFEGLGQTTVVRETKKGTLVVGSHESIVRVLNRKGQTLATCRGHEGPIFALCITHDDKILSGSYDGTIRLWDMHGKQLAVYRGHVGFVQTVSETKYGDIISGGSDRTVRIWDRSSGRLLFLCKGHEDRVKDVAVKFDGKLISRCDHGSIFTWSIRLLRDIVRMDELQAKVLWEILRSEKWGESEKGTLGWYFVEGVIKEQELERELNHWIFVLKLNPKSFELTN